MANAPFDVLVVDDEEVTCRLLQSILEREHFHVELAHDGGTALDRFRAEPQRFQLVLLDLMLPDLSGIEVLKAIKSFAPDTDVIMITGSSSIETAVEAVRLGAEDYLTKPVHEDDRLVKTVRRIVDRKFLEQQNERLKQELLRRNVPEIVGETPAIRQVLSDIAVVANADVPVLITGESGTGKELVARAIHHLGGRRSEPFVPVNCAAISKDLLESEFYGHERGAFSGAVGRKYGLFEVADKGTIFLDEIAEMPTGLQSKLLRTVETKQIRRVGGTQEYPVDFRIVCATNRDLKQDIAAGRFREDLYFRLSTFVLVLPPLRERRRDIPMLVKHFIGSKGLKDIKISERVMEALMRNDWPGNVRELEHVIERMLLLSKNNTLDVNDLPLDFRPIPGAAKPPIPFHSMEDIEREHILKTYEECDHDKVKTAQILKIGLQTLYRRLAKYGKK